MKGLEYINKSREYLDYLEAHLLNIQRAWTEIQAKCVDMRFVYDDFVYWGIDNEVLHHDLSKFSKEEIKSLDRRLIRSPLTIINM